MTTKTWTLTTADGAVSTYPSKGLAISARRLSGGTISRGKPSTAARAATAKQETAPQAARRNLEQIRTHLREIETELGELDTEEADWGNVGDLGNYREKLQDVADALLSRGEYDGR